MAEDKMMRLSLVAKQINVGISTIVQYLSAKGHKVDNNPNTKLNFEQLKLLAKEYRSDSLLDGMQPAAPVAPKAAEEAPTPSPKKQDDGMPLYFREGANEATKTEDKPKEVVPVIEPEKITARAEVTFKVLGKIELDGKGNPVPPKPVTPPVEPKAEPKVESVIVETPVVETKAPEVQVIATPTEAPAPVAPTPTIAEPTTELPVAVAPTQNENTPKEEVVVESKKVIAEEKPIVKAEPAPVVEEKKQPEPQPQPVAKIETPTAAEVKAQPHAQTHQGNRPQQHNQQANQQRNNQQNHQGQKPNNNQSNQNKLQNPVQQPQQPKPQPKRYDEVPTDRNIELIEAKGETLKGLTVLGKIELPVEQPRSSNNKNKKKRKRIKPAEKVTEAEIRNEKGAPRPKKDEPSKPGDGNKKPQGPNSGGGNNTNHSNNNNNNSNNSNNNNNNKKKPKKDEKEEVSDKQIQEQIKATMARLQGQTSKANFGAKERREKRKVRAEREEKRQMREEEEAKILKVTEFISASELASLMDVSVNEVISTCMSLGMFVSINQRLEADIIAIVHSHPDQSPEPSAMDRQFCERSQLPWHIVNPSDGSWGKCMPLIGRQWVWAISDCWTLVRDWYALHGLLLPDWDRPSLEEFEARPLFDGLWEAAGFYELPADALLQPGDALLMRIGDQQLNHVGVFIGNGMMLHHLRDQLTLGIIAGQD